jgi:hypothetical protein
MVYKLVLALSGFLTTGFGVFLLRQRRDFREKPLNLVRREVPTRYGPRLGTEADEVESSRMGLIMLGLMMIFMGGVAFLAAILG